MADWRRVTGAGGEAFDVNMETVAYMSRIGDLTGIVFVGGRSEAGQMAISVKETPDGVHRSKLFPE
jgi:hypothetical protein